MTEKSVPQFPRSRFQANMFFPRTLRDVVRVRVEFQIVLASEIRDQLLIGVRFLPAQLVIEMNNRKKDAEFVPQLQQQPQQRNRINPTGDRRANAIPGFEQLLPTNVRESALRQFMHGNMLQQQSRGGVAEPSPIGGRKWELIRYLGSANCAAATRLPIRETGSRGSVSSPRSRRIVQDEESFPWQDWNRNYTQPPRILRSTRAESRN